MRVYNEKISERANERLMQREAVVRKQKNLVILFIILLLSLGILLGGSVNALASSDTDIASCNKYYTSIQVQSGDTLWSIADAYIDGYTITKLEYISEVCKLNGICEDEIHAGDYIVVPYYSQTVR